MDRIGITRDGMTTVVGDPFGNINKIFISGKFQQAPNDFNVTFHRLSEVNGLQNSDYMDTVLGLKNNLHPPPDHIRPRHGSAE